MLIYEQKYKYEINSQLELEPLRAPTGPGPPRPLEPSTEDIKHIFRKPYNLFLENLLRLLLRINRDY